MHNPSRRVMLRTLAGVALIGAGGFVSRARAAIKPRADSALIVVDVQNCFVPGGTLPVNKGDEIVPIINALAKKFENVVITQDWHTPGHTSFASSHPGKKPFETIQLSYGTQVLWPDHCVQGTSDAALQKDLDIPHAQLVIRKGYHKDVDSYSAFKEADRKTDTGLAGYLKARGIKTVYVVGLATDFCVAWTAMDARAAGFNAFVVEDACRGIDLNGSVAAAWKSMAAKGVKRVQSSDFA
ncbi:MAG TPA: bifunctional nicotinamidase/pyrazinamidase [Burkholderiaceae bacterium]|nr:bifunctional nicotinamidase/pyrazinamidase [Burkholderiaceae bacterium]